MRRLLIMLLLGFFISSCSSYKELIYIQDVPASVGTEIKGFAEIKIQPNDLISIVVSSKIPDLAIPFNLPLVTYQSGNDMQSTSQRLLGYTVDMEGNIDFPILGKISVIGLTRVELAEMIKEKLISDNYINDPVITVQFMNFKVNVIGEVVKPGTYEISGSYITIFDALSMAGDLTVYGKRENIKVIREKNGERIVYMIDLRSEDLFSSQGYYLQQNDVIYVEPNKYKARQATNSNQFTQVSLWVSVASLIATVTMLIINNN